MAKKKTARKKTGQSVGRSTTASSPRRSADAKTRAKLTSKKIESLAETIVTSAKKKTSPHFDIPTRALSNVRFDPEKAFIEMGSAKQRRHFFDLGMAKKFMQTWGEEESSQE